MKGDNPNDDNSTQGSFRIEQAFSSTEVAEFIEIKKKYSKVQNGVSQTIEKYIKESYSTQSKIGQNAFIPNKASEQAIKIVGVTIEVMDIEIEQTDNIIEILENKIGLPDCKVFEEMNRLRKN